MITIPLFNNHKFEVVLEEGFNAAGNRDFLPKIVRGIDARISMAGENVVVVPFRVADEQLANELQSQISGSSLLFEIQNARNCFRASSEKHWAIAEHYEYSEND